MPWYVPLQFWDSKLGFKCENEKGRNGIGVIHLHNYHPCDTFIKI